MLRKDELGMIPAVDLKVYACNRCGFVQLTDNLGDQFYDDYLMTTSHSLQMRQFQQQQASNFVARYGLQSKRVVDVGCGDGSYMQRLAEAGADPTGIEPSSRFRELAVRRGMTVFPGYVGAESVIPEGPYDGFTTRQVLEHVPDPHDFLRGIHRSLGRNAPGLVEVPSLEQALERKRFYDFFPDHLNYFSQRTLRVALEMNGFVVDEITRGMNGEYNVAHVRVDSLLDETAFQDQTDRIISEVRRFFSGEQRARRRVAIWGSGGKGVSLMSIARAGDVAYVIDTDPHKQGRHTPVTHFPIVAPERLSEDPVETVLITALAYRDEILSQLIGQHAFAGRVAVLGPSLELVKE